MVTSIVSDYAAPMNLRDLRYLVALADERHFGRAAERCHVSQPTLSAQIRKLEEYLGVSLVERQPRRVSLTEAGVKVVERARRLLLEADAIVELAKTDRDPLAGRAQAGADPHRRALPAAARRAPPEARTAPAQADAVRVPDGAAAREAACRRDRHGHPGAARAARRTRGRAALRRAVHAGGARRPPARGPRAGPSRRPEGRDAAAARGRSLPARPGARGLQSHPGAGRAGLPRDQPRDAAPDGGGRAWRDADAPARGRFPGRRRARHAHQDRSCARRRRVPSAPSGGNRRRGRRRSTPRRTRYARP